MEDERTGTGDSGPSMTSHRPYLLRALNEWIADNGMTPHLLVDATRAGVQVPPQAVRDGKVVLNIAERAVARLLIDNDAVTLHRALRWREPSGDRADRRGARDLRARNGAGHGAARRSVGPARRTARRRRDATPETQGSDAAAARAPARHQVTRQCTLRLHVRRRASGRRTTPAVPCATPGARRAGRCRRTNTRSGTCARTRASRPRRAAGASPMACTDLVQPLHARGTAGIAPQRLGAFGGRTARAPVREGEALRRSSQPIDFAST